MSSLHFTVPVAADPAVVQKRMGTAAKDPAQFVGMFTTSPEITADVAEGGAGVWRIRVEGPQFKSAGTAAVRPASAVAGGASSYGDAKATAAHAVGANGTDIEIQIEVKGKGWLAIASPIIALASGKIEGEATEALQKEFGSR